MTWEVVGNIRGPAGPPGGGDAGLVYVGPEPPDPRGDYVLWVRELPAIPEIPVAANIEVVGSASGTGATLALPPHQAGDMIIFAARRANNTQPTLAAGWTAIYNVAGANTLSLTTAWRIATDSTTPTPTFTNADQVACIVLRGNAPLSAGPANTGNANNATNIAYPALSGVIANGTSMGVRIGARGTAATGQIAAPPGWTNRVNQPPTGNSFLGIHTMAELGGNITAATVTQTGSTPYRAHTFEVRIGTPPPIPPVPERITGMFRWDSDQGWIEIDGGGGGGVTGILDVTQPPYNADRTGATDASVAINEALDDAKGRAAVHVPAGEYLIANQSVTVPSNSTLWMSPQAVLRRANPFRLVPTIGVGTWHQWEIDYMVPPHTPPDHIPTDVDPPFLEENVTIIGGWLDVAGEPNRDTQDGNHLLAFNVRGLRIHGVRMGRSAGGAWYTRFRNVVGMVMSDCIIDQSVTFPERYDMWDDGIHIESGHHIVVTNCHVYTGDDAIALGGSGMPSTDLYAVSISNCSVRSTSRQVLVHVEGSNNRQNIYDVTISGITGSTVGPTSHSLGIDNMIDDDPGRIHHIRISDSVFGSPPTSAWTAVLNRASHISLDNVGFQSVFAWRVSHLSLSNCSARGPSATSSLLQFNSCDDLVITSGDFATETFIVLDIRDSNHVSLSGVKAQGAHGYVVNLEDSSYATVVGCNLRNVVFGPTWPHTAGVREIGTSDHNRILACDLSAHGAPHAQWGDPDPAGPNTRRLGNIGVADTGVPAIGPTAPPNPEIGDLWIDTSS